VPPVACEPAAFGDLQCCTQHSIPALKPAACRRQGSGRPPLHGSPCVTAALCGVSAAHQDRRLAELWEQHGGRPGNLDRIASALDAGVAKSAVAARLKALGLKRGVLTEGQVPCRWRA
jgi:hypothetical protein